MQEVPRGKNYYQKEKIKIQAEWKWLYQKVMECKNWTYEIWSYYLREGRKRDQIRNVLVKNDAKFGQMEEKCI